MPKRKPSSLSVLSARQRVECEALCTMNGLPH